MRSPSEIPSLVKKLTSVFAHKKRNAAGALGELAKVSEANRESIAQAGAIQPLVNLLSHRKVGIRENAVEALKLLAKNTANRNRIVLKGGIKPLVLLLSDSANIRNHATDALGWLAINEVNRVPIAQAGGIKPLVGLLSNRDVNIRKNAVEALKFLASNKENRAHIVEAGGIKPLVALLSDDLSDVRESTANTLGWLSVDEVNQERIAQAGGIKPLVALLSDGDVDTRKKAVEALTFLVRNTANKEYTAQAGGVEPLVLLLSDADVNIRKHVVEALGWLAINEANQERIAQAGGVEPLVLLLSDDNVEVRKSAAEALSVIALNTENQEYIAQAGGIKPLVALLSDDNAEVRNGVVAALSIVVKNSANQERIGQAGAIEPLVVFLSDRDIKIRKYAGQTLVWLALNAANRDRIAQAGGVKPLVALLSDGNEDVRSSAAGALWNLASNVANRERIAQADGIKPLVALLSDDNVNIRGYAVGALAWIAQNAVYKERIAQAGAIKPLLALLSDENKVTQVKAAGAVFLLSLNPANKEKIAEAGGIESLVKISLSDITLSPNESHHLFSFIANAQSLRSLYLNRISFSDEEAGLLLKAVMQSRSINELYVNNAGLKPRVTEALEAHLRRNAGGNSFKLESGGSTENSVPLVFRASRRSALSIYSKSAEAAVSRILSLVALLFDKTPGTQEYAVGELSELAYYGANKGDIAQAGGVPPLVALLSNKNSRVRESAARAISRLAFANEKNQELIGRAGGVLSLLVLLSDKSLKIRNNAVTALSSLAHNVANNKSIVEVGGIPTLVALLYDNDPEIRNSVMVTLFIIANNATNQKRIALAGGVERLVLLLSDKSPDAQGHAVVALNCLSKNIANSEHIAKAGGIPPLVLMLSDGDEKIRENAVETLRYLARNAGNRERIAEVGGIKSLVILLSDGSEIIRSDAAGALWLLSLNAENKQSIAQAGGIKLVVEINLSYISLALNESHYLFSFIANAKSLRSLTFSGIAFTGGEVVELLEAVRSNKSLIFLGIYNTGLKASVIEALEAHLCRNAGGGSFKLISGGSTENLAPLVFKDLTPNEALSVDGASSQPAASSSLPPSLIQGGQGKASASKPPAEPSQRVTMPPQPARRKATSKLVIPPIDRFDEAEFVDTKRQYACGPSYCSGVFKRKNGQLYAGASNNFVTEDSSEAYACAGKIALDIYEALGVPVPETAIARLPMVFSEGQTAKDIAGIDDSRTHTVYLLSEVLMGFYSFTEIPKFSGGDKFYSDHPGSSKKLEVINFGRILAVAKILNDINVLGDSAENLVFQVVGNKAHCFKIDAPEAFNMNSELKVGPRQIRFAIQSDYNTINFDDLPQSVKQEFLETIAMFLRISSRDLAKFFVRRGTENLVAFDSSRKISSMPKILLERQAIFKREFAAELFGTKPQGMEPHALHTGQVTAEDVVATMSNRKLVLDKRAALMSRRAQPAQGMQHTISHHDLKYSQTEESCIGSGAFSKVYTGTWGDKVVAIKKLMLQGMSLEASVELRKEAAIMRQLDHPNVMKLYGACVDPGHYSLVLKYMAYGTLFKLINDPDTELDWGVRIHLAQGIIAGIKYLHERSIMHRDLKSLNILLDEGQVPVIADFGLSKVRAETKTTMVRTKASASGVGTVAWMAPELFKRRAKYSKGSDIFAFAVILWELGARRIPWSDEATANDTTIALWVRDGDRNDMPQGVPEAFAGLIKHCWAQERTARPTAQTIQERLASMKDGLFSEGGAASAEAEINAPVF